MNNCIRFSITCVFSFGLNILLNVTFTNFIVTFLYDLYIKEGWGKSIWGYLITSREGITFYGLLCVLSISVIHALGIIISMVTSYTTILILDYLTNKIKKNQNTSKEESKQLIRSKMPNYGYRP